jgi:hypothetical protein
MKVLSQIFRPKCNLLPALATKHATRPIGTAGVTL